MNDDRLTRRHLLSAAAGGVGALSLAPIFAQLGACTRDAPGARFQPKLVGDGLFRVPEGFSVHAFSRVGERMDDGQRVPELHDGMGLFEPPSGGYVLVRNHEVAAVERSPLPDAAYDPRCRGGTTTVRLDAELNVTHQHLSLTGTLRNCSGGVTPWNTWLSCEERFQTTDARPHGYVFEIDPAARRIRPAEPLTAMGRFEHEAAGVGAETGIVYLTEDRLDACFYRFVPSVPGKLSHGGRLQALSVRDMPRADTRRSELFEHARECAWVDIEEPDPEQDTVRRQGHDRGAAKFARSEGLWMGADGIYFVCTLGGRAGKGQVFRYRPTRGGGDLQMVFDGHEAHLAHPDNLTITPWGDLLVCEDRSGPVNRLVLIGRDGDTGVVAESDRGGWTGMNFSRDGRVLFVNLQYQGVTLAISGSWRGLMAKMQGPRA